MAPRDPAQRASFDNHKSPLSSLTLQAIDSYIHTLEGYTISVNP